MNNTWLTHQGRKKETKVYGKKYDFYYMRRKQTRKPSEINAYNICYHLPRTADILKKFYFSYTFTISHVKHIKFIHNGDVLYSLNIDPSKKYPKKKIKTKKGKETVFVFFPFLPFIFLTQIPYGHYVIQLEFSNAS